MTVVRAAWSMVPRGLAAAAAIGLVANPEFKMHENRLRVFRLGFEFRSAAPPRYHRRTGGKTMRFRPAVSLLAIVAIAVLTGCFDIEQSLVLNKDLSGKAGFRMAIDFEPMVLVMLQMQREMDGKKGAPTAEEIAKAKTDFLKESSSKSEGPTAEEQKEFEKKLPEGVKLLDQKVTQDGMKMITNIVFGFTDPSKLALIDLPKKEGASPQDKSVIDKPFDGLVVKDEGKTILITSKPADPMSGVEQGTKESGGPENKEMEAMVRNAMKGLRVAYRIEAPFKVVESNATRREGNTLIWEYTLETFEKMQKTGMKDLGVFVRFKK
jgi:hypothetical protein